MRSQLGPFNKRDIIPKLPKKKAQSLQEDWAFWYDSLTRKNR